MLISGRLDAVNNSDMKPNIPFLDLVLLRALVPELETARLLYSVVGIAGIDSFASAKKAASDGEAAIGLDRRRAGSVDGSVGNISFSVAVLARDGRGGGDTISFEIDWEMEVFWE